MSYKRSLTILALFIGGYASVMGVGENTTKVLWDANAFCAALVAAGLAQPALSDASAFVQVATTIGAMAFGYFTVESSIGYRYAIDFDWRALMGALAGAGLVHANNQNITQSVKATLGIAPLIPPKP